MKALICQVMKLYKDEQPGCDCEKDTDSNSCDEDCEKMIDQLFNKQMAKGMSFEAAMGDSFKSEGRPGDSMTKEVELFESPVQQKEEEIKKGSDGSSDGFEEISTTK